MHRLFLALFALFVMALSGPVMADDDFKNKGRGTITDEVVIGTFTVAFFHEKKEKLRDFDGGRSTMEIALAGLTPAQLQAVTEAAYADFVAQLSAAGITVRDRSEFATLLAQGGRLRPQDQGHETKMYFGRDRTEGRVLVYSPAALGGPLPVRIHEGLMLQFRGFGSMRLMPSSLQFEQAAEDYVESAGIAVINPLFVIDFADFDKYEGSYVRSIEARSSLALTATQNGVHQTSVHFYGANGREGRILLDTPLAVSGDFGRIGRARDAGAGTPVGATLGHSTDTRYLYTADTVLWSEGVGMLLSAISPMFAEQLNARR